MGVIKAIWGFIRKNPVAAILTMALGFVAVMLIGGKVKEKLTEVAEKVKPGAGSDKA